jgi:hypothetical protein
MARWSGALCLAALSTVLGCGSVTAGHASPSPLPSAAAPLALTDGDAGRTFHLRSGQVLSVVLHQPQGYTPWTDLHSTDPAVLAPRVDTRRMAVRGVTLGSFRAAAAGTARLEATTGISCPPLKVCPALARAWVVTVRVT